LLDDFHRWKKKSIEEKTLAHSSRMGMIDEIMTSAFKVVLQTYSAAAG
jgi:hypothetical protein